MNTEALRDARTAVSLARLHTAALTRWRDHRTHGAFTYLDRVEHMRSAHQKHTGWVASVEETGRIRLFYTDPATRPIPGDIDG